MAWTTPMTFVDNTPLTAEQLNIYLRDNLLETETAKATTKGGMFVGNGPNSIVERIPAWASVSASESTNSTSYVALETLGPTVTLTTGARALVFMSMTLQNSGIEAETWASYEISGATVQAASDNTSMLSDGLTEDKRSSRMIVFMEEDLKPGINTFTIKYRVGSGVNTGVWGNRFIGVWPI